MHKESSYGLTLNLKKKSVTLDWIINSPTFILIHQWYQQTMSCWYQQTISCWYQQTTSCWYQQTMSRWYQQTMSRWFNGLGWTWQIYWPHRGGPPLSHPLHCHVQPRPLKSTWHDLLISTRHGLLILTRHGLLISTRRGLLISLVNQNYTSVTPTKNLISFRLRS